MACLDRIWPLALSLLAALLACPATAATGDRERRCLAMIAYAEAATEGPAGMLAVMKVVHNRIADPRFADDACAVALEPGQFQPVGERPALRRALREPEGRSLAEAVGATSRTARLRLVAGVAAGRRCRGLARARSHGGALYFVNPRLMDPVKCPWFARLKRTAVIGEHVFMRHYAPGERPQRRALDCAVAGMGYAKSLPRTASR